MTEGLTLPPSVNTEYLHYRRGKAKNVSFRAGKAGVGISWYNALCLGEPTKGRTAYYEIATALRASQ